jgi:hypothetical protein
MLETIYEHLDTTTTIASTATASTASDSNEPSNWGKEVRRSADGRASVFVQDLGRGQKIIRHVFWAEPRGQAH